MGIRSQMGVTVRGDLASGNGKVTIDRRRSGFRRVILRNFRRFFALYLRQGSRIWRHMPPWLRRGLAGRAFGRHLHALTQRYVERKQSFGTFFLRNRPELELMCRLLARKPQGADVRIAVLACSKGAEVYSILWAIRGARPDLRIRLHALDISPDILKFAERGVYSRMDAESSGQRDQESASPVRDVIWNTHRDQNASLFGRMTDAETAAMFEVEGGQARIRRWLKEGIVWLLGNAGHPDLVGDVGRQDIVVANRFLCHMTPPAAEQCLRNIQQLVEPGGYLFVSGVDLDVRTKVAKELGWKPVTLLLREVYEGDASLSEGWPLQYWGLEPFCADRPDWQIRFASVFQVGEQTDSQRSPARFANAGQTMA